MYDNKIRFDKELLRDAENRARKMGMKNARALIEKVFRENVERYLPPEENGTTERREFVGLGDK